MPARDDRDEIGAHGDHDRNGARRADVAADWQATYTATGSVTLSDAIVRSIRLQLARVKRLPDARRVTSSHLGTGMNHTPQAPPFTRSIHGSFTPGSGGTGRDANDPNRHRAPLRVAVQHSDVVGIEA